LRKPAMRCFMSVCPSVRVQQLGSQWKDFYKILYLIIFPKSVEKIHISLQSDNNNRHCTCRPIYTLIISRCVPLRKRNVSDKSVEKIKTHILCPVTFSLKSYRLLDNVEKYGTAGQTTDGNTAHAHCVLDT
jgi:hypothetical protein